MSDLFNEVMSELDWDSEISHDNEFTILPEGDYTFTVKKFERARHNGSAKLPPCNKAVLTLEVTDGVKKTTIEHNLFLHQKTEGMLCEFFTAIGQRKHGEKLRMNWPAVMGATGRCKVYVDKWQGKDGQPKESNKIKKFITSASETASSAPTASAAPTAGGWNPGKF